MEEMDDEFGDLYADVEIRVSPAINAVPSFNQLYLLHENKNDISDAKEGLLSDSSLKNTELISEDKELNLYGSDLKTSIAEAEGEKDLILDDGSDSEDDLNIVLNEDYQIPRGTNMGNGRTMEGSNDKDEDDNLVVVNDGDCPIKDRKWVEQLQLRSDGGLEQSSASPGAERGNGIKGSYISQYSQYKYIRPCAAAFPNKAKANGSGVSVSSSFPLSSRSDWDVNGCIQQTGSSSGPISSSCSTAIPAVAQNGFNFSHRRNRTILDIGIETFERKPWRHPGVDITDFFNFGLNEGSWKHYCNRLEHFWRQATMLKKIPVYESLRPNQLCEAEFDHKTIAPEDAGEEPAQIGQGERGGRLLEMPKGRAIQVEDSIGERQPSMDVRRPRNRDSDVVIQISVQDSREDSSGSGMEEPMRIDTSIREVSENDGSCMGDKQDTHSTEFADGYSRKDDVSPVKNAGVCSLRRCSLPKAVSNALFLDPDSQGNEHILDVDVYHHQKVKEHGTEETTDAIETIKNIKEGNNRDPSKADSFILEAQSPLGNQIQCTLSSSDCHSRSKALMAGFNVDMEKTHNHAKRLSPKSVSGLQEATTSDHHCSKDTGNNDDKTDQGYYKNDSGSPNPMQEENCCSRMRLCSVAELKTQVDDDEAFSVSDRKGWHSGNHLTKSRGTRRGRHHDYDFYDGEDLLYHREAETLIGYHNGRFSKNQIRNGCTEVRHRKGNPHFRDERNLYLSRHWGEREPFLEKRITVKENKIKQREHYPCERGSTNVKMRSFTHGETMRSTSENSSFYAGKEEYPSHKWKRDYEYWSKKGRAEDKDFVVEHRYNEECSKEKYGKPVPYNSRKRKYLLENSEKNVPYNGRQMRSSKGKERYSSSTYLDLDNSLMPVGCDDEYWRQSGDESLHSYLHRESHYTNGRGWHDTPLPRNDLYGSRKLDERNNADNWRHSEECSDSDWLDPEYKDDCDAHRTVHPEEYIFYERRYSRQSKGLYWVKDDLSSRHQNHCRLYAKEQSFMYERTSRHERIHVDHDSADDGLLVENRVVQDRNRMTREEENFEDSNIVNSSGDVIDKHEHTMPRCRHSVGLDLVGWKGKSSGRSSGVRYARCNGRRDNTDHMDTRCIATSDNIDRRIVEDHSIFRHSDESYSRNGAQYHFPNVRSKCLNTISSKNKVGLCDLQSTDRGNETWLNKYKVTEQHKTSVLEEGQLEVEKPGKKECSSEKKASEKIIPVEDMKEKRFRSGDTVKENRVAGGYENNRILETLAKMERRRERFKEPITLKEVDKSPSPQCDPVIETAEVKQQRPARKRRWGGS